MPRVSVDGFQLYYESEGDGEPLVLIPGFASGHGIWARQVGPLSHHFRVITFDPRGVAASDNPAGPQTIGLLADDLATLLKGAGVESAHILGASFGGFTLSQVLDLIRPAFTIAMLGSIESLLSAVVADNMARTRHDSNQ